MVALTKPNYKFMSYKRIQDKLLIVGEYFFKTNSKVDTGKI